MSRNVRPSTPTLRISSAGVGPTSPPQTPTSASPVLNRKLSSRHLPPFHNLSRPVVRNSNIHPIGHAHQFSYTRSIRPEQLSPRSSTSSEEEEDDDEEEEEEEEDENGSEPESSASGSPPRSSSSEHESSDDEEEADDSDLGGNQSEERQFQEFVDSDDELHDEPIPNEPPQPVHIRVGRLTSISTIIVEEMSDFDPMDSENEYLNIIHPTSFEYPDSDRSFSRGRNPELDRGMMGLDINCSDDSDDYDPEEEDHKEFIRKQKELKMQKRRSHGSSIGKRTHSERSDSDKEDLMPLDADMVGSSARRLRRRVGDRRSLQFQDPPPPRIDELEEPDSCEDEIIFGDGETLARELPYYSMEIMEIDSS